jgi:hypothetical protein
MEQVDAFVKHAAVHDVSAVYPGMNMCLPSGQKAVILIMDSNTRGRISIMAGFSL